MVNTNADVLGVLFPNSYDSLVPELVNERLMASIPFGGRYRIVDFVLSSMVNCGIDNISLIVRRNYLSLMDHLGSGREWDLARKNGGLNIIPPFAEKTVKIYNGRVEALASILDFLRTQKETYVVLADTNIVANFDFNALIDQHVRTGADVTIAYTEGEIPDSAKAVHGQDVDLYYTIDMDEDQRVNYMYMNPTQDGKVNFSMNYYVVKRELLIDMVNVGSVRGMSLFERDILSPHLDRMKVYGYKYDGYVARISDLKSYFDENMKLLDDRNLDALFSPSPIYTKIRDDNPTRYIAGAVAENVLVADGCVIEGDIENSILFRGVKIGKGAKVRNCVLMQDTVIEEGANVEYVITDKKVTITSGKELKGTDSFPVYIAKHKVV